MKTLTLKLVVSLVLSIAFFSFPVLASVSTNENGWNQHGRMLYNVSKRNDVDLMDLVVMASIESTMGKHNYSRTSSAEGLFGFTASTWRVMVKRYGKQYGVRPGTPRTNPRANALIAVAYMKENRDFLERSLHRPVRLDEIYMAHLLGPGGAVNILKAHDNRFAYSVVKGARSNRSYFYSGRRPFTVAQFKAHMRAVILAHQKAYRQQVTLFAFQNQLPISITYIS